MNVRLLFCAVMTVCGCLTAVSAAADNLEAVVDHVPDPSAWQSWAPRPEIAPSFAVEAHRGRDGGTALKITAQKRSDFGAWRNTIGGVRPRQTYRFVAWYRSEGLANERRSVIARLQWLDGTGTPLKASARPPEYPLDVAREGGWTRIESVVTAPEGASSLDVQLSLGFTPQGSVAWDQVRLVEITPPPGRNVRVMTVHHRPRNSPSAAANVAQFAKIIRDAAGHKPDIVCLPEGMTVVGTGKSYAEVGEALPGPTTETLGALARELRCYIVAGLYEREAPAIYNTAVLIDRDGLLVGRYRKSHLPREEWESGLTPGDNYPIFKTDFGTVGLLVCWDLQFPEPWRAVGLQGAELVLLPIWGGNETLLRARAIENHAFVVSSSYDMKSCVVGPDGTILAEATKAAPAMTTTINLDQKVYQPWLGDMSTRTWKERRGELPP